MGRTDTWCIYIQKKNLFTDSLIALKERSVLTPTDSLGTFMF